MTFSESPSPPVKDKYWYLPIVFVCLLALYFFVNADPHYSSLENPYEPGRDFWKLKAALAFCSATTVLNSTAAQSLGYVVFAAPAMLMLFKRMAVRKAIASAGITSSLMLVSLLIPLAVLAFTSYLDQISSLMNYMTGNAPYLNVLLLLTMYLLGFLIFAYMTLMLFDAAIRQPSSHADVIFSGITGMMLVILCIAAPAMLLCIVLYVPHPVTGQDFQTGTHYDDTLSNIALFVVPYLALMAMMLGWYIKMISLRASLTGISCAILILAGASLASGLGAVSAYCP